VRNPRGNKAQSKRRRCGARGFTLLELMVVIAIIIILATLGAGRYEQTVVRAREATLHQDLFVMRQAIQSYTNDKDAGPSSLDDLVSSGYMRAVPLDPITHQKDWTTESGDLLVTPQETAIGISDVHSASSKISPFEGTPYSEW
jgi:general secretion pathway protein G